MMLLLYQSILGLDAVLQVAGCPHFGIFVQQPRYPPAALGRLSGFRCGLF
jgi:hypothetical protein